mgnify:CR=1 FL=1
MKTGIFSWFSYSLPLEERLRLIKDAGFDAVSLWWGEENRRKHPDMARKVGLEIDNIHMPFSHPNDLWTDGLAGDAYLDMLISCVRDCAEYGIPAAVAHITGFSEPPGISAIGVERVNRLIDFAENKQVYLAIENLNYLEHLDYIFQNNHSEYLGFCYDSGHEHCFHPEADCLSRYGGRLRALQIDDNCGDHDTHLLPYDGTLNWDSVRERLKRCREAQYLTLEVDFNPKHEKSRIYETLSAADFLRAAYERARKVAY